MPLKLDVPVLENEIIRRRSMKTHLFGLGFLSFILIALVSCISCGGGGGRAYPPTVAINKIGLIKVPLKKTLQYETSKFSETYEDWQAMYRIVKEQYGESYAGKRFNYIMPFSFGDKKYILTLHDMNIYIYYNEKLVKILGLPRYGMEAKTLAIELKGKEFLVVYINQQATSRSSTLFVLDKNFDIQYEEHFLRALSLGHGSSEEYDNFFVIESGYEPGTREDLRKLNIKWLYHLGEESVVGKP